MKIFITCPNINSQHGGIRVILEWANRLQAFGHEVILYDQNGHLKCNWFNVTCRIVNNTFILNKCDCLIITSPHAYQLVNTNFKGKKFVFLQMMEDYFFPNKQPFINKCKILYNAPCPLISISQWNIQELKNKYYRKNPIHYIGNGINLNDFPISNKEKNKKIILLESPEPTNVSKDVERIALKVAERLVFDGYIIKGYGLKKPKDQIFTEFIERPSLAQMNRLYEEAYLMIKATKYDARSTAPIEAMTKGTVTIRGIIQGDDDLNETNSYKTGYSYDKVLDATMFALNNPNDVKKKSVNCIKYVQDNTWDIWMPKINEILING